MIGFVVREYTDRIDGPALRSAREQAGIKLRELSRRVGISPTHLSLLERGMANAGPDVLRRIVAAMGGETKPAPVIAAGPSKRMGRAGVVAMADALFSNYDDATLKALWNEMANRWERSEGAA